MNLKHYWSWMQIVTNIRNSNKNNYYYLITTFTNFLIDLRLLSSLGSLMKKLSIKKSITAFIEGWVEELADPFTSWLYQSVLHWNVIMLIADGTFNDYDISFEDICLKINPRVGSRTSIQNIIKVGIEKNYFIKNPSLSDNRKKVLLLSDLGKKCFEEFIEKDASVYIYE